MNISEITTLIDQFQENGDAQAFFQKYNALNTNHTTPLGLNQWCLSDKPTMEDFNRDNIKIDEKLQELAMISFKPFWPCIAAIALN